jgi:hypothetical protein
MKSCPECGKDNLDGAEFCQHCGKRISEPFFKKPPINPNQGQKLDKRLIITACIILLIIISVALYFNPLKQPTTSTVNSNPNIAFLTYDNELISFNYPETWKTLPNQTQYTVVALGNPSSKNNSTGSYSTYISVVKEDLPSGQNLKDTFDATYSAQKSQDSSYQPISNQSITIDGKTAYGIIYQKNISNVLKKEEAVWVAKNGITYVITLSTLPSDFDTNLDNLNLILQSFLIK